jgi:hypothetical protein
MITQERLKELFHYNPDTGVFTWKASWKKVEAGTEAGSTFQHGRTRYSRIGMDGAHYLAHRLAWLYVHGSFPEGQTDHIDGDGLNNRIDNLRDVSHRENQKNRRLNCNNKSGFTGVHFDKSAGKWSARICTEHGSKFLGLFKDIEGAVEARRAAAVEHGYHENHGKIRP